MQMPSDFTDDYRKKEHEQTSSSSYEFGFGNNGNKTDQLNMGSDVEPFMTWDGTASKHLSGRAQTSSCHRSIGSSKKHGQLPWVK